MHWLYYVCISLMKMLLVTSSRWQVNGLENVPGNGGLLIVANHISMIDPPLVAASLKRRVSFLAKEELFSNGVWRKFFLAVGAVPIYRGSSNRRALEQTETLLKQGRALVMFPEGSRSPDARMRDGFHGCALLAARSGVPILPVGITGTEQLRKRFWILRRPVITVNIGAAFYLPSAGGKISRRDLASHTETIMEHIAELLSHEYRGIYGAKRGVIDAVKD